MRLKIKDIQVNDAILILKQIWNYSKYTARVKSGKRNCNDMHSILSEIPKKDVEKGTSL